MSESERGREEEREKKRERTKRAMLPSVPFIDDEVTSQQVLEC